jgi:hypothetical protein
MNFPGKLIAEKLEELGKAFQGNYDHSNGLKVVKNNLL